MVKEKKLLCRACAKVYPAKTKVQQYTIDTGLPVDRTVKLHRCPTCHGTLVPLVKRR